MSEYETTPVSFARLPSQGIIYGLNGASIGILGAGAAIASIAVITGGAAGFLVSFVFWGPMTALGLLKAYGEPWITHLSREVLGMTRQLVGATKYRRRPDMRTKVKPSGALDLPGRDGRLFLYESESGSVVVWDAQAGTATISCVVGTIGLGIPDAAVPSTVTPELRDGAINEWAKVLGSFTTKSHIVRVTVLEQTRPGTVAAERRYAENMAGTGAAAASYEAALDAADEQAVLHTARLAITFQLVDEAKTLVKSGGGGKAGMLSLAELEMSATTDALFTAGFQRVAWLTPREWGSWGRSLIDPASQRVVDSRIGTELEGVAPIDALPMYVHDQRTVVETDTAWHRSYWIQEWPRYFTEPGFLSRLVFAKNGDGVPVRHSLALVATPVQVGAALRRIDEEKRTWVTNSSLRGKTGKQESAADGADWDAIVAHEQELIAGQGELRFSAFLTISAMSQEELEHECISALNACSRAGLEPRLIPWQQYEALLNVAYPCGLGMK